MEIKKIMEKASALKIINDIKDRLYNVDLDELCGESIEISESSENDVIFKKLVQAVMCGLVYWDEDKNCLAQKLIRPLQSGQQSADTLYYQTSLKLNDTRTFAAQNQAELTIQSLAAVCSRSTQLIGQLWGQDLTIAVACLGFFDK